MVQQGRASAREGLRRDPLLGRVIDARYTVLHLLGKGGMGAVYRAHQASLDRAVALKVLLGAPDHARETEFQRRFFLEASTVAKLKHPNTITVFDYGSEDIMDLKIYFIAMELLEGRTLTQALKDGALTLRQTLSITAQICRSLREAHKAGVIHRDLKPGNVMLMPHDDDPEGDQEFVKVLDFGLAKTWEEEEQNLTKAGTFLGSPRYVPPEQIEGRATDPRSDIYSLGCVMYRMITGQVPFDGNAPVEIMLKHLNEAPPPLPPSTPPLLSKLVMAMLEKQPNHRPDSMEEVINRLKLVRAAAGERVGFLSFSDDGHAQIRPPVVETTKPDRKRPPPSQAPVAVVHPGRVALDEAPPTKRMGKSRSDRPAPSRAVQFGRGLVAGALVALTTLLAFELGLDDWLEARLNGSPPPTPATQVGGTEVKTAPAARARLVRLRLRSDPNADLVELIGADQVPRGRTPLDLDWPVGPDVAARTFLVMKKGYRVQPLAVPIPNDNGEDPQIVELDVELSREK